MYHSLHVPQNALVSEVRPILKSTRDTLILREIPDDATEAELRDLVSKAPCDPKILSVDKEVNQTWFIKLGGEQVCQDVSQRRVGRQSPKAHELFASAAVEIVFRNSACDLWSTGRIGKPKFVLGLSGQGDYTVTPPAVYIL